MIYRWCPNGWDWLANLEAGDLGIAMFFVLFGLAIYWLDGRVNTTK